MVRNMQLLIYSVRPSIYLVYVVGGCCKEIDKRRLCAYCPAILFLYSFSVLVIFYVQQLFGFGEEVVLG
jgi:hypothetical protein